MPGTNWPRVALCGPGAMGSILTRMLVDRGYPLVAGITRPGSAKIGRDLGTLAGLSPLGVRVTGDARRALAEARPDVVVVAVSSNLDDGLFAVLECAVEAGANVVTLAEEVLYPAPTSPVLSGRLDELAKRHDVTVLGTGYQDVYWVNLPAVLAGSAQHLTALRGATSWNVDDHGATIARYQRVGLTEEEFAEWVREAGRPPTFGANALHALAAALGLRPSGEVVTTTEPELAPAETYCRSLDEAVPAGRVLGYTDTDTLATVGGPELVLRSTGKVYRPGDADYTEWTAAGVPAMHLRCEEPDTAVTTCAAAVNRIPDVLSAPAGLITIDRLPQISYRRPVVAHR